MNRSKSQLHFHHVLKDAKPQARRALLASADDELIKDNVECAIKTLNGAHKWTKDEKNKLRKYKNRLRALVRPKYSFKSKRKLLIQKFIVPLLTSIFSGVIEPLISNNNWKWHCGVWFLVPPELWENRWQAPIPPR
jgi:hypothetical protein